MSLQGAIRGMIFVLQRMIDCRDVSEGTVAWEHTNEALQIGRQAVEEYGNSNIGGRNMRGGSLVLDRRPFYILMWT